MKKLLLVPLILLCMADDCDPAKTEGVQGTPCYQNGSCDWGLTCLQWKDKGGAAKSACADPLNVKIGYVEFVKCEAKAPECPKCPDPPVVRIAELRCPQPAPPVHCPPSVRCPICPKIPEGPCPEIKECQPAWR